MNPDGSSSGTTEPGLAGSPFVNAQRIEMDTAPSSAPDNSSSAKTAPEGPRSEDTMHGKEETSSKKQEESNLVHFDDRQSFNFALALAWIIALLSIVGTLYFWWLNRNLADVLADKKEKRTAIVSQLESPGNKEIETEANNFKASVTALSAAKLLRNPMTTFLPDFYTKVDNDVKVTSLSVSSGGALSIAGVTASYRAIADQVMALKSWSSLSEVDLASSSYSVDAEDKDQAAQFSITAKINQSTATTSASSSATSAATGETQ